MNKTILLMTALGLCASSLSAHDDNHNIKWDGPGLRPKIEVNESVYMVRRHGDIVIECEKFQDRVAISQEGELFINDVKIRTSKKEKELLIEYHELANAVFESADEIGEEGIKVGLKGAELGIKAATGVFKILLPGYSAEDFEKDMEKAAEKVEKKAEKLEARAEKLETMVEHLEDIQSELRDSIKELENLGWF